jgi:2-oxoisovalerate dehydrogenase E1 component
MSSARDESLPPLYRSLYRIRRVEEKIIEVYPTDKVKSPVHLSIGQESVSVGVCAALLPDDIVFGTYRGHALYLAKGGDLKRMIAELYGKVDGAARGKAGSMHLVDMSVHMMGTSAIVATTIPQAVGYAFALKVRKAKQIVACFFGEGAMDEGVCYESLNFAALRKLPVLFICENNHYAIYSHIRDRMPHPDPCERAGVFRIPNERIDHGDTLRIRDTAQRAVAKVRAGEGPQFIECMTYRWRDHVGPDEDRKWKYRPDEELDAWIRRDELERLGQMLEVSERRNIEAAAEAEIAEAFAYAEASAFPGPEELATNVFAR